MLFQLAFLHCHLGTWASGFGVIIDIGVDFLVCLFGMGVPWSLFSLWSSGLCDQGSPPELELDFWWLTGSLVEHVFSVSVWSWNMVRRRDRQVRNKVRGPQ